MSQASSSICMKVSMILSFLLLFQNSKAQYNFNELDNKLNKYQTQLGKNIVTIIYKDSGVIYNKSLGDFNATTQAPIASCSKWLTAALVMVFVDEGKLSLDDKVSKYLPIFLEYGKGYITIKHCLSHLTGIQGDRPGLMSILKMSRYKSLEDEVNDFASKYEIETNPGIEFRYSNIGLNIAGRVLEVIGKKSFDRLMVEKIFRPLGMKNSTFSSERAINPSGGAKSTANDYMNFLIMILNKGMFKDTRILSEESVKTMQQAQTSLQMIKYGPLSAQGFNYGLGEWILETNEKGNSTVVTSPGLFGTWPMVNLSRRYACIFFVKTLLSEQKKDIYLDLIKSIDEQIPEEM